MTKIAKTFQDAAFGPEVTQAMAAAFDKACQSVKGRPQEIPLRDADCEIDHRIGPTGRA
jgi:hypothetical protein